MIILTLNGSLISCCTNHLIVLLKMKISVHINFIIKLIKSFKATDEVLSVILQVYVMFTVKRSQFNEMVIVQ